MIDVIRRGKQGDPGKQGIQGIQGPAGLSIIAAEIVTQGDYKDHLILTFSDGSTHDAGIAKGADGAGNGDMKTTDYATGSGSNTKKIDHAILADSLADNAATDTAVGNRTVDQTIATAAANTGTLTQILSWFAKIFVAITGGISWSDPPVATLKSLFSQTWFSSRDLVSPAAGYISTPLMIPRQSKHMSTQFIVQGAPSAATILEVFTGGRSNSISAALTNSATTITLANPITLSAATDMLIDILSTTPEVVKITAIGGTTLSGTPVTGNSLTITRAQQATTAAAHNSGAAIMLSAGSVSVSAAGIASVTDGNTQVAAGDLWCVSVGGTGLSALNVPSIGSWVNR
ncbi:MAG: hypothetical protein E6713_03025 [Sporomusaceae bacterium]|nr:hypothetical protein [Sporomusaceae bacterium]